jgi:hypothetical protein
MVCWGHGHRRFTRSEGFPESLLCDSDTANLAKQSDRKSYKGHSVSTSLDFNAKPNVRKGSRAALRNRVLSARFLGGRHPRVDDEGKHRLPGAGGESQPRGLTTTAPGWLGVRVNCRPAATSAHIEVRVRLSLARRCAPTCKEPIRSQGATSDKPCPCLDVYLNLTLDRLRLR